MFKNHQSLLKAESSFGYIMDHETWSVDLALANAGNIPEWSKLYSARADLGIQGVSPSHWRDVLDRSVHADMKDLMSTIFQLSKVFHK